MILMMSINSIELVNNSFSGYMIGGMIAFFIMCYLLYSLAKPEKF